MQLAYDRCGAGPPLVLLHGAGHRRQGWLPVRERLAEHREVISLDLPGFGESPPLPNHLSYGLDTAVVVLKEFFADLGLDRPHVAGNSMGGLISLELARYGMVSSATALSPAGLWSPMERRVSLSMVRSVHRTARYMPPKVAVRLSRSAAGRTLMCGVLFGRPDLLEPRVLLEDMRAMIDAVGFRPSLAAGEEIIFTGRVSDVPVTIAWGSRDLVFRRPRAASVTRLIPHARLLRLPGCGHVPMNDNPELVAHVLLTGSDDEEPQPPLR
ncbi:MAG: alpha/beta fold hydrolase [Pseudonocardiales bacterium]|nr:alpha/beta fold hydrolase [Pseudonocardiales bacterium]MBV9028899.1 alpha/beta fold hydrolase [Pseudonocardiales bacterium]MBW0010279.1 alpha/beta fold hydrolase [Pseudonocardiales bacterium]